MINQNKSNDNIIEFRNLLIKASGRNTVSMFLNKCEIDRYYISDLLNRKTDIFPNKELLKVIARNSEGRVTYEELLKSCNYPVYHDSNNNNNQQIKKGDIFIVDLGNGVGSEQAGERPVVIIQNNIGNKYSPTVIVAAITSQMAKAKIPTHVEIGQECGLFKPSVCMLEQIRTIDKSRLIQYIGSCPSETMIKLNKAFKISGGVYDLLDEVIDEIDTIEQTSKDSYLTNKVLKFKKAVFNKMKEYATEIASQINVTGDEEYYVKQN